MSAGTKITGMRLTEDTLAELRAVAERLAEQTGEPPNLSAAVRYAIRQAFLGLKKTSKKTGKVS